MAIMVGIAAGSGVALSSGGSITGNLEVTGTLTMGGRAFFVPGTEGAPGVSFVGATTAGITGSYGGTLGNMALIRAGAATLSMSANGLASRVVLITDTGGLVINNGQPFRAIPSAKTANYQFVAGVDFAVSFNGVGLIGTMPASPTTATRHLALNLHATESVTLARNGKTINGATSDYTLLPMTAAHLEYNSTANNWFLLAGV